MHAITQMNFKNFANKQKKLDEKGSHIIWSRLYEMPQ